MQHPLIPTSYRAISQVLQPPSSHSFKIFSSRWLLQTLLGALALSLFVPSALFGATKEASSNLLPIGVVDFQRCILDSKVGQAEQEKLEAMSKEITERIESVEKELQSIQQKENDPDYIDSLSPEAEKELATNKQRFYEQYVNMQQQLYQLMNQGQMRMVENVRVYTMRAAQAIARQRELQQVLDGNLMFYYDSKADITDPVIEEMNEVYAKENDHLKSPE